MPPTINNNQPPPPPQPAPDMSRILANMAEMNSNFSGLGSLNGVIQGMNDRQSALESRLTQQYGLQNDFNNDQAHFNNQARSFFNNTQSQPPPIPQNYYFGGFGRGFEESSNLAGGFRPRETDNETDSNVSDMGYAQSNTQNPFQFQERQPVIPLDQLQLDNNNDDNAYSMIPDVRQPDYSIPRYISLPNAPDANYNEPLQLTDGNADEEEPLNLPIVNSDAENIVFHFTPQPNLLEPAKDGVVQTRINDLEAMKNEREARRQQKQDEQDAKQARDAKGYVAKQEEGDVIPESRARDGHEKKLSDLLKLDEMGNNAKVGYGDDFDNILKDFDWFMNSMEEQKFTDTRYGPEIQKTMKGEELKIYNKLMKVGTKDTYKGDATATHRTTAWKNIKAREDNIKEFVKRNQPKQQLPDFNQKDYVPLDERTMTMADLKNNSSAAAAPSTSGINFG